MNVEQNEGTPLYKTNCPSCPSSDAFVIYDTGTGYCFSCGHWARVDGEEKATSKTVSRGTTTMSLLTGEYIKLSKRGISEATCRRYSYMVGTDKDNNPVQIATYYDVEGQKVAQKLRGANKTFKFIGEPKEALMFGQQLFSSGGKKLTITEGEIDALSLAEAFGKSYPIVSIKNGAQSAKKEISKHIEWINSFDEIYLWFDNDEQGNKAVEDCVPLLPVGRVKIIKHPEYKDANDVLLHTGTSGVTSTFYSAQDYKPDGFVSPEDLLEEALKPIEWGIPWFLSKLTKLSYGRRLGEIVLVGAGVSIGKTDMLMQQIADDVHNNRKVATFMLEQGKVETLLRVCGKLDGTFYHLPDVEYDKAKLKQTINAINDRLFIYDNFGRIDWQTIKAKIRSASITYGIKLFYIDNLTALNAHAEDERRNLDGLMEEVASLAKELNIWILLVSHLNPPKKGASHESGGRVEQSQFTGSRAIQRWSQFMLGIERNTLHEDISERRKGLVRCIKDRFSGKGTGQTVNFIYDQDTGLWHEVEEEFELDVGGDYDGNEDF